MPLSLDVDGRGSRTQQHGPRHHLDAARSCRAKPILASSRRATAAAWRLAAISWFSLGDHSAYL